MSKRKSMVRKQLYIESEQNMALRELASKHGVSEGQIVREAITEYLTVGTQSQEIDLSAWEEERLFMLSRQNLAQSDSKSDGQRTWTRGELYDL
ncbi:MAG: hypothetical protein GX251_06990 [Firmicutes bacterium]|nr:hypothetical protein [Bacillota bacterium]